MSGGPEITEVNTINRQKFLAELSKLLTFMYEEDRLRALKMYERMFDITEDEQGLIQHLMSPTRQAVIIARAYDAKERKLSVSSQSRGDDGDIAGGEVPKFVLAINRIFDDLFPAEAKDLPEADQVSFFDLGLAGKEDFEAARPAVPAGAVLLSDTQKFHLDPAGEDAVDVLKDHSPEGIGAVLEKAHQAAAPAAKQSAAGAEASDGTPDYFAEGASIDELISSWKKDLEAENAPGADEAPSFVAADHPDPDSAVIPAGDSSASEGGTASSDDHTAFESEASAHDDADADAEGPVSDEWTDSAEPAFPEEESAHASDSEDLPDGFVPDFSPAEEPEDFASGPNAEDYGRSGFEAVEAEAEDTGDAASVQAHERAAAAVTRRKTSPVKLIPFLIVAIPVSLVLLALLLVPALLFLGAACSLAVLGGTLAVSAFQGFSVFADLLLLLGTALVILALALLFVWLAVSVIWSGMGGLIRRVIQLGQKLCTKEVPAE